MDMHYRPHTIGRPVVKQYITPMALKARFNLSQFELDKIINAASTEPSVWRQGQLELGLAIDCVKRLKGWA